MEKCIAIKSRTETSLAKEGSFLISATLRQSLTELKSYLATTEPDLRDVTLNIYQLLYSVHTMIEGHNGGFNWFAIPLPYSDAFPYEFLKEDIDLEQLKANITESIKFAEQKYGVFQVHEQLNPFHNLACPPDLENCFGQEFVKSASKITISSYTSMTNKMFEDLIWGVYKITSTVSLGEMTSEFQRFWQHECFKNQVKQVYIQDVLAKGKLSCYEIVSHKGALNSLSALNNARDVLKLVNSLEYTDLKTENIIEFAVSSYQQKLQLKLKAEEICQAVFKDIETAIDEDTASRKKHFDYLLEPHSKKFELALFELEQAIRSKDITLAIKLYTEQTPILTEDHIISLMLLSTYYNTEELAKQIFQQYQSLFTHELHKDLLKLSIDNKGWELATVIFKANADNFSSSELISLFKLANTQKAWELVEVIFNTKKELFSKDDIIHLIHLQYPGTREWGEESKKATNLALKLFLSGYEDNFFTNEDIFSLIQSSMEENAWGLPNEIFNITYGSIAFQEKATNQINSDIQKFVSTVDKKYSQNKYSHPELKFLSTLFINTQNIISKENVIKISNFLIQGYYNSTWNLLKTVFEKKIDLFIEDNNLVENTLKLIISKQNWNVAEEFLVAEELFTKTFSNPKFIEIHGSSIYQQVVDIISYAINRIQSRNSESCTPFLSKAFSYISKSIPTETSLSLIKEAIKNGIVKFPNQAFELINPFLNIDNTESIIELLKLAIIKQNWGFAQLLLEHQKAIFNESTKAQYLELLKLAITNQGTNFSEYLYENYKFQFFTNKAAAPEIAQIIKLALDHTQKLAAKIYEEQKSHLSGEDFAQLISKFVAKIEGDSLFFKLIEDAYNSGNEKKLFNNDNIVLIIKSLLINHPYDTIPEQLLNLVSKVYHDYQEVLSPLNITNIIFYSIVKNTWEPISDKQLEFGLQILQSKVEILSEDDVIKLIATSLTSKHNLALVKQIYQTKTFEKNFLKNLFLQIKDKLYTSDSEYILQFLLEVAGGHYDKLGKEQLSNEFITAINSNIYSLAWEGRTNVLDKINQVIDHSVIAVSKEKFFFQTTKDSCFGQKSDLTFIDTKELAYPLEVVQNSCDTKIKLQGNKILVAHGHQASEVFKFILEKTQNANSTTPITVPVNILTAYTNPGHGFLSLGNANDKANDEIQGFYPSDANTYLGFDYITSAIVWGTTFISTNFFTTLATGLTSSLIAATFAHPIITLSFVAALGLAAYYDISNGKNGYLKPLMDETFKTLTDETYIKIFGEAVTKILSGYNELNGIFGAKLSTTSILTTSLVSTFATSKYLFGGKIAAANLALHTIAAMSTIFSKEYEYAKSQAYSAGKYMGGLFSDYLPSINFDFGKFIPTSVKDSYNKISNAIVFPFKVYTYLGTLTQSFSFVTGKIQNDDHSFEYSKENNFPKISFIISDEQKEKAKQLIEAVKNNCQSENIDLCVYQALSKNCYQFVQDVKEHIGLGEISYYAYLTKEQRENLFIDKIPMVDSTWKSKTADEIELPAYPPNAEFDQV